MDDQSLRNVLALLRSIKDHGANMTGGQYAEFLATGVNPRQLVRLAGSEQANFAVIARVAAYISDQISQASSVIENSQLVEEAKTGVRNALAVMAQSFSVQFMNTSLSGLAENSPAYISNLVILLSAAGLPLKVEVPKEASDLAADIDEFAKNFDDPELDPVVREIAKKHMVILATMLRHIPAFGVEAATQSYFELLIKMRRADSKSTEATKGKMDKVMDVVKTWGERLKTVDGLMNTGATLLDRAHGAAPLLQYIPGVGI